MLGFFPLSSSPLADIGAGNLPVIEVSGVQATGEVTNQPIAFENATIEISGVNASVEGAGYVDIMIGAFSTLYALNLIAELEPLPLTGLTRLKIIDSAGELTAENGLAGVPTATSISGIEANSSVGTITASVDVAQLISGLNLTAEMSSSSVVVNKTMPIGGFGLALEIDDLSNSPHVQSVNGFDLTSQTEELDNSSHGQSVSGFDLTTEIEDLSNTPVIQSITGVDCTIEIGDLDNTSVIQTITGVEGTIDTEGLGNTPVIQSIVGGEGTIELEPVDNTSVIKLLAGVDGTIELEPVDNRPGNATRVGSLELISQTEAVAIAHGCGIELADLECLSSAGNVIVTIAQRRTILGVQAVQELNDLEAIFIAFPISIGVGGAQAVTALGTVQLIEVVRVPFAKSLPAGLSNFVFLSPANANSAIVDNKINRLG